MSFFHIQVDHTSLFQYPSHVINLGFLGHRPILVRGKCIMLDKAECLKTQIFERIIFFIRQLKAKQTQSQSGKFSSPTAQLPINIRISIERSGSVAWTATYFYAVKELWVWKPVSGFHSISVAAGHLSSHLIQELAFCLFQVGSFNALVGTGFMQSQQATKNSCCLDFLPLNSNLNTSPIKEPSVHSSYHSDMLLNQQKWWHHLVS